MDRNFMLRAINLARGGLGQVSPNPLVGSLIVKNSTIIGEGFHRFYGDKHGEIHALESCSESAYGATLYCNLEPCSCSYPGKKNPPCCDAIIKSGISRVVIAQIDPNPMVSGAGIKRLQSHGIEVVIGIESEKAYELNRGFNTIMRLKRPYVHIKWAQSLDGQIATGNGISKWISSLDCRKETHFHRSQCDGIMVGRKTLESDNPTLDSRYGFSPSPRPVVLDALLKSSPDLNIFKRNPIIICNDKVSTAHRSRYKGEFVILSGNNFSVSTILDSIRALGINSVFIEGGSNLVTQFIKAEIWDRITIYIAPKILGQGIPSMGSLPVNHPKEGIIFGESKIDILDDHIVFNGFKEKRFPCLQV